MMSINTCTHQHFQPAVRQDNNPLANCFPQPLPWNPLMFRQENSSYPFNNLTPARNYSSANNSSDHQNCQTSQSLPSSITSPYNFSFHECFEADWFIDISGDDTSEEDRPNSGLKFDLPVLAEPVVPIEQLTIAIMDDFEFYCDSEDYIQVYTDGSYRCHFGDSFSAIGIWFGPNHKLNVSQPTTLGGFNSDGAELEAIIEAIKIACSCGVEKVQINTDSQNAIRFLTYFIGKWEANGWRNIKGLPVRNQNLIRQLDEYSRLVKIKFNYVPSCAGVHGNVEADRLARNASAACAGMQPAPRKRTTDSNYGPTRINRKTRRYTPY